MKAASSRAILDGLCAGAIDQEYFAQLSQVIALLLATVGLEATLFQLLPDEPVQRAMTIFTVALLSVGEALAISALPKSNEGCGNVLTAWHEYVAFIMTLEAAFIELALLGWALATMPPRERQNGKPLGGGRQGS